ncbi:MAG: Ig-like domain-containing protein, partial [Bacteroidota bacterium]
SEAVELTINASELNGGNYQAEVIISSNDPENEEIRVPVNLEITGEPTLSVQSDSVIFDPIFVGQSTSKTIVLENTGTDLLSVSDVSFDNADFSVDITSFELSPNESITLTIEYFPTSDGENVDQLLITSNDAENSTTFVDLISTALIPPVITIDSDSLYETLEENSESTQFFNIDNTAGGSDLNFELSQFSLSASSSATNTKVFEGQEVIQNTKKTDVDESENDIYQQSRKSEPKNTSSQALNLEDLLGRLDTAHSNLTNLIPDNYLFSNGFTGTNISDGGGDMYDGGNRLNTDFGGEINYSNNEIDSSFYLDNKAYFTAKYDGLFIFSGDVSSVNSFSIEGNLGADGSGSADGAVIEMTKNGKNYIGFVKRVFDAYDPSVNHLVIVEDNGLVNHEFSTNTDNDFHGINDLSDIDNLHYLLFAGTSGKYYDNTVMTNVMEAYLDMIDTRASWLSMEPTEGTVPAGQQMEIAVNFNANELEIGDYNAQIIVNHNDPDQTEIDLPVSLNVIEEVINEAPVMSDQVFRIDEKPFSDEVVGQIQAEDINDDTLSFRILNSSATGALNLSTSGVLSVGDSTLIDFDLHNVIDLSIEVSDGELQDTAAISVIIEEVIGNEAPEINDQIFKIDENSPNGTVIGDLEAVDQNQDELTFGKVSSEFDSAVSLSNSGTLTITDSAVFDYENNTSIQFYVTVFDGEFTDSAEVVILINDIEENSAPTISDQEFEIDENSTTGTEIGTIVATDSDGDELSYSLTSSEIDGAVALSSSGILTVADSASFDYESNISIEIGVRVSDGEFTDSAVVLITVLDVNENTAPTIDNQEFEIDENSTTGSEIGSIVATDAEGDELSYSLTSSEIDGAVALSSSGILTVADSASFDYESNTSFEIEVSVTDGEFSNSAVMLITILDVHENTAPSISDQAFEVNENSPTGTEIGSIVATDAEGDELSYNLTTSEIDGAIDLSPSGILTVSDSASFDYESNTSIEIGVSVSDGEFTDSAVVLITILDVNENTAPSISNQLFEVEENANNGFEIGEIEAFDSEGDSLSYMIANSQIEGAFGLSENGVLSVLDSSLINSEKYSSIVLLVEVSDGQLTDEAIITIKVIEAEDEILGNQDITENLILYPNPVIDQLIIQYDFKDQNSSLYIIDMKGRMLEIDYITNEGQLNINTVDLASGVYQLIIKDGDALHQAKFIKQ